MTKLWTPEGNEEQLEIDVKVASLDNYINKVSIDLDRINFRVVELEERSNELRDWLTSLNKKVKIVSIKEYKAIRSELLTVNKQLTSEKNFFKMTLDAIVSYKKTKEDLLILREKAATKILEFNFNERSGKRS